MLVESSTNGKWPKAGPMKFLTQRSEKGCG